MYGKAAAEPETLPKFKVRPQSVKLSRRKEHETVAKVVALAVAEPETVSNFTAWVVAERETATQLMARSLQRLRLLRNSWHGGRRA